MTRYPIRCPGCDATFGVRLGVAPTKMTRFYVPCPSCDLPIRGWQAGQELDKHQVEFEAELDFKTEPTKVVTVDPNVPSLLSAAQLGEFGAGTNIMFVQLLGENAGDGSMFLERGRQVVEEIWPQVRRLYEYYLAQNWPRFDATGSALFETAWTSPSTTHERATAAHQALGIVLHAILDDHDDSSSRFLSRYMRKHLAALRKPLYVTQLTTDRVDGHIAALQRSVFDTIDLFIQRIDAWHSGLIRRLVPEENEQMLTDLRLFRDEFDVVRDLYQQGFEVICKTLRYPVATQNAVKRDDPNDFGTDVPSALDRKSNPTTLSKYDSKISNYEKIAYVSQVPGWSDFTELLDNKTRNSIGHATARHDLRTGLVFSTVTPDGLPYFDLIGQVYGVFDALAIVVQVLRHVRIASSPDFKRTQLDLKGLTIP